MIAHNRRPKRSVYMGRWPHSNGFSGRKNSDPHCQAGRRFAAYTHRCSIRGRRERAVCPGNLLAVLYPIPQAGISDTVTKRVCHASKWPVWLIFAAVLFNDTASNTGYLKSRYVGRIIGEPVGM